MSRETQLIRRPNNITASSSNVKLGDSEFTSITAGIRDGRSSQWQKILLVRIRTRQAPNRIEHDMGENSRSILTGLLRRTRQLEWYREPLHQRKPILQNMDLPNHQCFPSCTLRKSMPKGQRGYMLEGWKMRVCPMMT